MAAAQTSRYSSCCKKRLAEWHICRQRCPEGDPEWWSTADTPQCRSKPSRRRPFSLSNNAAHIQSPQSISHLPTDFISLVLGNTSIHELLNCQWTVSRYDEGAGDDARAPQAGAMMGPIHGTPSSVERNVNFAGMCGAGVVGDYRRGRRIQPSC